MSGSAPYERILFLLSIKTTLLNLFSLLLCSFVVLVLFSMIKSSSKVLINNSKDFSFIQIKSSSHKIYLILSFYLPKRRYGSKKDRLIHINTRFQNLNCIFDTKNFRGSSALNVPIFLFIARDKSTLLRSEAPLQITFLNGIILFAINCKMLLIWLLIS